jgi:ribosomal protein L37AE/L43A
MVKEVKITKDRFAWTGYNADNEDIYFCPECEDAAVSRGDNFCCNCGVKIKWELKNGMFKL